MTRKKCPNCGENLIVGHKNDKGIVSFLITEKYPANVLACEKCWHDQPLNPEKKINNPG